MQSKNCKTFSSIFLPEIKDYHMILKILYRYSILDLSLIMEAADS